MLGAACSHRRANHEGALATGPRPEIAPGVHAVGLWGAMCHVIGDDEGVTLIDAGLPGSRRRLVGALSALGRSPADIVRIVCTHGHPDHAGGVRELERDRTEVLMHAADIDGLSVRLSGLVRRPSRGRLFAYVTPTPRDARPLSDGQVLPVL